ncbi:hypothetical protein GIB67_019013 [Kingdonia uniflora]|uniref:VTT domain-containing protein n=1 Tax=Kingdonia uniflora TaxID=39325 RepID=A0A7J7MZK3_9MAGN|nr:hypothetical protein GIB67_019013 [Kingdonia uniflora]
MTFNDESVVPELKMRLGNNGDYVKLRESSNYEIEEFRGDEPMSPRKGSRCWWWWKMILLCILATVIGVVFFVWVGPYLLNKEVVPILDWEIATFSPQLLGVLLFLSLAFLPSLLLPSTPSMWVAGITFGYGFGFLLILAGMTIGMSFAYFIGSLFHHKIQTCLEKWPQKAAILRLAGAGDWFHQFRAVVLFRISPFPFVIFNYAAVAANVTYAPYLIGSIVGLIPEIFVTIYSGILIRSLADASQGDKPLSTSQIIYNVLGFCTTVATTATITIYAKRALKKLQEEEEQLLE